MLQGGLRPGPRPRPDRLRPRLPTSRSEAQRSDPTSSEARRRGGLRGLPAGGGRGRVGWMMPAREASRHLSAPRPARRRPPVGYIGSRSEPYPYSSSCSSSMSFLRFAGELFGDLDRTATIRSPRPRPSRRGMPGRRRRRVARLGARRDLHGAFLALEGRHVDLGAGGRLRERHRQLVHQNRSRRGGTAGAAVLDGDVQVAGGAAELAGWPCPARRSVWPSSTPPGTGPWRRSVRTCRRRGTRAGSLAISPAPWQVAHAVADERAARMGDLAPPAARRARDPRPPWRPCPGRLRTAWGGRARSPCRRRRPPPRGRAGPWRGCGAAGRVGVGQPAPAPKPPPNISPKMSWKWLEDVRDVPERPRTPGPRGPRGRTGRRPGASAGRSGPRRPPRPP